MACSSCNPDNIRDFLSEFKNRMNLSHADAMRYSMRVIRRIWTERSEEEAVEFVQALSQEDVDLSSLGWALKESGFNAEASESLRK